MSITLGGRLVRCDKRGCRAVVRAPQGDGKLQATLEGWHVFNDEAWCPDHRGI